MLINFLKDLANKPYEIRRRIFWFTIILTAIVLAAGWVSLEKKPWPANGDNFSNLRLPSLNEMVPPELMNRINDIGNLELGNVPAANMNNAVSGNSFRK